MRNTFIALALLASVAQARAQQPAGMAQTNGLSDWRPTPMALVHARLWLSPDKVIEDGMLQWQNGRITYAGPMRPTGADVQTWDARGKTVYPAFVEMISDIGIPQPPPNANSNWWRSPQYQRENLTDRYWNEHIRPEVRADEVYKYDDGAASALRKAGFGYALTHVRDGIARGTGAIVALTPERANAYSPIVRADAAACYSFGRARNSAQVYPTSLMGSIALLRQALLDAQAYGSKGTGNASLQALNQTAGLPQLFEAGQRLNVLRADKLGDEAGRSFIMKGNGDEYARLEALKRTGAPLVVPVNYPKAYDVADPLEAENIDLTDLMHQERAPFNLGMVHKAGITLAVTTDQLKDKGDFLTNLRKAVKCGLPEKEALRALTATPARLLKAEAELGSLEAGRWASFVIADKSLFTAEGKVLETWVAGQRYMQTDAFGPDLAGLYRLTLGADSSYTLTVTKAGEASLRGNGADTTKRKLDWRTADGYLTFAGKLLPDTSGTTRASGLLVAGSGLAGVAALPSGQSLPWRLRRVGDVADKADTAKFRPEVPKFGPVPYPFAAYGWTEAPKVETILYRKATVWTNEGPRQEGADVLVSGGKIVSVGKGLAAPAGGRVVDATGKHITPGLIDEHSHIAINGGVNEGSHSVSAEVRIGDVINSEDPNIYRHLAGGVVAVQQLHGSANTIGGQSALVKMRWGAEPEQMKVAGADGFIKCALGENVKQSNWGDANTTRYPQTRMGVEQVFKEAFARAQAYRAERQSYDKLPAKEKAARPAPKRDLQLEAVLEILDRKRFITCHSYVASEILMLMRVADSLGFRVNTFTHILEGYKVAEQMKKHGVAASTFSDWWYYKMEVRDAIPYNAAMMHNMGITVAINSDDAEMGRRLNQEAAKIVRYGGVSEEDALKMITLNPARMLHLDKQMGSLKAGKDADLVVWDKHPFAPGAKPVKTVVDGKVLFDLQADLAARTRVAAEKNRLLKLQAESKDKGMPALPGRNPKMYHCDDMDGTDESWALQ